MKPLQEVKEKAKPAARGEKVFLKGMRQEDAPGPVYTENSTEGLRKRTGLLFPLFAALYETAGESSRRFQAACVYDSFIRRLRNSH